VIGEVLGDRFVLEAAIGAGGMGTVHRAFDRTTGRAVAVKVGRADAQRDDARFEDEIALLAELSHPGIVGYIGHGVTGDGRPFLAMELLEGEDLGARLARGPLSTDEALAVVRGAAEALDLRADLGRRAIRLLEAAPRLRGKEASAVVERLLAEDAQGAAAGRMTSDRSSRRLFERLVELGVARELTGRPTFRLYGL